MKKHKKMIPEFEYAAVSSLGHKAMGSHNMKRNAIAQRNKLNAIFKAGCYPERYRVVRVLVRQA